jgi:excisionase family DNA binding protein
VKTTLENEDIQAIADQIIEKLMPVLSKNGKRELEDDILTPDEVASLLRVKKAQIYSWVAESKFTEDGMPYQKAGKFLRFSRNDVLKWTQRHKKG